LDFDADIYDKIMQVDFLKFLRPEEKFDGIEGLRRQITADCLSAREFVLSGGDKMGAPDYKLPA
jgi:riboflavin kinase/FMN adenylyltransferase